MNKTVPRVTIGLPVYNGENYVAEAIRSILDQSFGDLRLVISDNASNDATSRICERYAREDARVEFYRQSRNLGAAPNFNFVFQRSQSPYFKWAAHDDVLGRDFIAHGVAALDARPEVAIAHARCGKLDEQGRRIGDYDDELPLAAARPSERFFRALWVDHFTEIWGLMRAEVLRRTNLIGPFVGSDRNLLIEMLLQGEIEYADEHLIFRRSHPECYCNSRASHADQLRWFDSSKRHGAGQGIALKTGAYFQALLRYRLSPGERAHCMRHLLHWAWVRTRQKVGRLRRLEEEQRKIRAKLAPPCEPTSPQGFAG